MFKKEWEPARGTIVASKYFAPTHTYDFVIDVQPAGGAPVFRATCSTPPYAMARIKLPYVGDVVPVLCDAKRRKVKIDLDDPALQLFPGVKGTVEADRANFDAALKGAPGSTPPGAPPTPSGAVPAASRSSHGGVVDELAKLADLRDRGALTDAEFEAQKVKLLSDS